LTILSAWLIWFICELTRSPRIGQRFVWCWEFVTRASFITRASCCFCRYDEHSYLADLRRPRGRRCSGGSNRRAGASGIARSSQLSRRRLDTITVPYATHIGSTVKPGVVHLLMDFREPIIVGTFVFHCHILEHEDYGMMAKIQVVGPAPAVSNPRGFHQGFINNVK
jgi:hypothetical protein